LYGTAFEIDFDKSLIQTDSVKIIYTSSFLNNNNQNIQFQKPVFANGKMYAATVRIDHINANGSGKIGEFWYKLNSGLPSNTTVNLGVSNANKVSANASFGVFSVEGPISLLVNADVTSLLHNGDLDRVISVYPNPAKHNLTLTSDVNATFTYSLYDLTGRVVASGNFYGSANINLSSIEGGVYLLRLESEKNQTFKKILIEK